MAVTSPWSSVASVTCPSHPGTVPSSLQLSLQVGGHGCQLPLAPSCLPDPLVAGSHNC